MRRNPNGREPARRQRGTNADGDCEHPSGNQTWITDFAQSSVCRAQLCRHQSRVLFEHERDCSLGPKTDRVESARVNLSISCRMPRPIVCWLPRPFVAHVFLHPAHAKQSEHQYVGGECAIQAKMIACLRTNVAGARHRCTRWISQIRQLCRKVHRSSKWIDLGVRLDTRRSLSRHAP